MTLKEQLAIQAMYSQKAAKKDEPKGADIPAAKVDAPKRGRPKKKAD